VIGGYDGEKRLSNVEAIDINDPSANCPLIPDYPETIDSLTAAFYEGRVIACGGVALDDVIGDCFELGPDLQEWIQMRGLPYGKNYDMRSSVMGNLWIISGGQTHREELITFSDGSSFTPGKYCIRSSLKLCRTLF